MKRKGVIAAPAVVLILFVAACLRREPGIFRDATKTSRVDFRWRSDIVEAKLVATMGGGAALGDFDNDGRLDLFLPNSVRRYKATSNERNCGKLYRGRGDGTFEEVTEIGHSPVRLGIRGLLGGPRQRRLARPLRHEPRGKRALVQQRRRHVHEGAARPFPR